MSYSFFGVQVVFKNFFRDPLRKNLHQLIAENAKAQSLAEKRTFWKRVTATLNTAMPVFERGYWDLIRGDKAEAEFETWTSELEGALATEAEEMGPAADEMNRLSAERQYVLVSIAFLVGEASNADKTLGQRCDLPESDWFTRQTFAHLIATAPLLNFADVKADAIYLIPGNDEDGLSEDDLADEGYNYLKALS